MRYFNNWHFRQYANLHSSLLYENGRERSGITEKFWRAGGSVGLTIPLSRKLSVTPQYQVIYKDSDTANRDYFQNLVSVELHYVF